jgi:tetratricopeptide (TPR) repeat protein
MSSPQRKSELRLFVSSTFRDLQEEREYLIKKVFPEIRSICRLRGVTFTEVDLRWGLTEEQQRLGRIIRTCLEEIDRCRPYFIGIIGRRYGWMPEYHEVIMDPEIQDRYPWIEALSLDGASLLEMEFTHGVLNGDGEKASFYHRIEENIVIDEPERLEQLIGKVRDTGNSIKEFKTPEELGESVRAELLRIIDESWPLAEVPSALGLERLTHEAFAHSRRRAYIANPEYLQGFNQWLTSNTTPLVIAAPSGMGKSALLTWLLGEYKRKNPKAFVIEHYVGASDDSTDHVGFIRRIIGEIQERYGLESDIPTSIDELERSFTEILARIGNVSGFEDDTLFIALDAVDQLLPHSRSFGWLPKDFPDNIKLLVSCRMGETLDELQKRNWQQLEMRLLKEREREAIVARYLGEYHKELPSAILQRIGKDDKAASPLFLRTLSEELRLYGKHESLADVVDRYMATSDLDHFFIHILERMENDYGAEIVRSVTTALASSRSGLTESHLLGASGVSRADLSLLLHALDYHLLRTNGRLNFFHQYLRRAVEAKYLSDTSACYQSHRRLAEYFREFYEVSLSQVVKESDNSLIREMLYQYAASDDKERLRAALLDPAIFQLLFEGETEYEFLHYWKSIGELDVASTYEKTFKTADPGVMLQLARLYRSVGAWELSEKKLSDVVASSTTTSPTRLKALWMLGDVQMLRGNPGQALATFEEKRKLAGELHDERATAESLGGIGAILLERGEYDEALKSFEEVLRIAKSHSDRRSMVRALVKIGQICFHTGQYQDAMNNYQSALEVIGTLGDQRERAFVLGQIGLVHWNTGEFSKAMDCFREEMETAENIGDSHGYAMAAGKIGLVELDKGDLAAAEEHFKEYLTLTEVLGYKRGIGYAHGDIGIVALRRGEYEAALKEFEKALTIHIEIDFSAGKALWLRWKAEAVLEASITDSQLSASLELAFEWNCESLSISNATGNKDTLFDAQLVNARLLFGLGNVNDSMVALQTLLAEATIPLQQAALHYWLWKLFGRDMDMSTHQYNALILYKDLLHQTKKYLFNKRIAELTSA